MKRIIKIIYYKFLLPLLFTIMQFLVLAIIDIYTDFITDLGLGLFSAFAFFLTGNYFKSNKEQWKV